jgi:hypothetical protein
MTLFGDSPICVMSSTTKMTIALGSGATILPGDTISFNSFKSCSDSPVPMSTQLVTLAASTEAQSVAPVIRLIGPSIISTCDTLKIRASANWLGGRQASFVWFIDSTSAAPVLTSTGSSSVYNISMSLLPTFTAGSTHIIYVNVTNFMGSYSMEQITIIATSRVLPSLISVGGASRTIAYNSELSMRALLRSSASSCFDLSNVRPSCSWSAIASNGTPLGWLGNGTALVLQTSAYLQPSTSYIFTIYCLMDPLTFISMNYSVNVAAKQPPVAWIEGGQRRTICSASSSTSSIAMITMDGTLSYDPSTSTTSSLSYTWSCRTQIGSLPCLNQNSPTLAAITLPSNSSWSIVASQLLAEHYIFSLQVGTNDGRTATSREQYVTILPCDIISVPQATIHMSIPDKVTPLWFASSNSIAVSSSSTIRLTGTVTTPFVRSTSLSFVWSIMGGEINTAGSSTVATYTSRDLVLNGRPVNGINYLSPGASYRARLTITDSTTGYWSSSSILLTSSFPPAFGSVSLNLNSTAVLSRLQVDAVSFETRSPPSSIGNVGTGVSAVNGQQLAYRYFYLDTSR